MFVVFAGKLGSGIRDQRQRNPSATLKSYQELWQTVFATPGMTGCFCLVRHFFNVFFCVLHEGGSTSQVLQFSVGLPRRWDRVGSGFSGALGGLTVQDWKHCPAKVPFWFLNVWKYESNLLNILSENESKCAFYRPVVIWTYQQISFLTLKIIFIPFTV